MVLLFVLHAVMRPVAANLDMSGQAQVNHGQVQGMQPGPVRAMHAALLAIHRHFRPIKHTKQMDRNRPRAQLQGARRARVLS